MKRNKIHIDLIFKKGLKNLRFLVSQKDLNAIEQKTNLFNNSEIEFSNKLPIEFEINELDWLKTQEKLAHEKKSISINNKLADSFQNFEIPISQNDWNAVQSKLNKSKKHKPILWLYSFVTLGLLALVLLIGIEPTNKSNKQVSVNENQIKTINPNKNDKIFKNLSTPPFSANTKQKNNLKFNIPKQSTDNDIISTNHLKKPIILSTENNDIVIENNNKYIEKSPNSANNEDESLMKICTFKNHLFVLFPDLKNEFIEQVSINKPTLKIAKPIVFIGIDNGITYFNKQLSSSNPSGYNNLRNQSDQHSFAYSKGLSIGLIKGTKEFKIAVTQSHFKQKSNYNLTYKIYDSIPVKDPSGKIIGYFFARERDTTINEFHQISKNLLNANFSIAEMWKLNKKTNFVTGIGLNLQINSQTKGTKILNAETLKLEPLASKSQNYRRLLLMPSFSVGIQKHLFKNIILQTDISSQISLNNLYKNKIVKEYPYQVSSHIKLIYLIK